MHYRHTILQDHGDPSLLLDREGEKKKWALARKRVSIIVIHWQGPPDLRIWRQTCSPLDHVESPAVSEMPFCPKIASRIVYMTMMIQGTAA